MAADHAGDRDPFLRRQPVLVALVGIEPDADENVVARRRTAGLEHLEEEARPVGEVAAIGVLAIVGERRQELAHQVGRCQDLDAIEPAFPASPRRIAKVPDNVRDFTRGQDIGNGMVGRVAERRRSPGRQPVAGIPGGAAAHVGDLAHQARAMAVNAARELPERRNHPIVADIDLPVDGTGVARDVRRSAEHGETDAAPGLGLVIGLVALPRQPVHRVPRCVGAREDPVAEGASANGDG